MKMNQCAIQQGVFSACEDMWSSVSDKKDVVVCPKPRRLGVLNATINEPIRPLRWQSHQQELGDSRAGADILDMILAKGGADQSSAAQVASSPPFFCGSPPSRVSNPLIQDARFGDEKVTPVSPRAIPIPSGLTTSSPSASTRKGGCVRANFGNNPAVRVEGFDCLDRDRRNCSIPALA
ncbi:hypothetical protein P3S67_030436 [Capsicum chacoense]|uniref:Uncharacterized protein n=1 Tax=Capsicum annuum TaxID=4072 RepID=A0A1U8ELD8_CAPAN|nr:uncharacterized protein LOC107847927 [Capsicum annuum]KAF3646573.1 putative zinc finger protein CONSTANS-LIKE 16-like [Capsicum annuum]KAF3656055.1 putative zinc finger protein CONSTANS-LIKE 16-like [Capsicum annuum]PHT67350.1 hypothetical protein T459_26837 [Capsicum annuum]